MAHFLVTPERWPRSSLIPAHECNFHGGALPMKHQTLKSVLSRAALVLFVLLTPALALAQGSPWESAAQILEQAFTGIIARAFSLIAIVAGGLTLAYGEGSGNRRMAGVIFGVGMAVGAVNFLSWLFGA
jgi:type IV secretory pathway VirB2 component (pilin)